MKNRYLVGGPITPLLISELMTLGNDDNAAGAISIFIGKVRDDEVNGNRIEALDYSAYSEMAEKEADGIVKTVKAAFSDVRKVLLVHSTGMVKAGEVSLFIMVTSGHRDHATRACRHTLEMIKERLPVWKKEIF
ncbi:MAG: molybdenum cofactor biosynthesis protein MoaE [Bacteroidales bacterium]|nr:molybdenum cofactor biosynthesis protein MoaE [Bacteroidales bacterium]MDT8373683.1 molybdenum cofactor biosynthesis protein MoaE [Bacteroidales bacterium]